MSGLIPKVRQQKAHKHFFPFPPWEGLLLEAGLKLHVAKDDPALSHFQVPIAPFPLSSGPGIEPRASRTLDNDSYTNAATTTLQEAHSPQEHLKW